jgi:serine protease inhibitor
LPKFTQETELDLIPILKNIGINKLFVNADADDMLESKIPSFLSILKQKAKIIVDKNGTEASAVTMGSIMFTTMRPNMSKVYDFVENHPFKYYIVYSGPSEHSSMILFEGTFV